MENKECLKNTRFRELIDKDILDILGEIDTTIANENSKKSIANEDYIDVDFSTAQLYNSLKKYKATLEQNKDKFYNLSYSDIQAVQKVINLLTTQFEENKLDWN